MSTSTQPVTPAAERSPWSARIFSLPVVMGAGLLALLVFISNPNSGPNRFLADPDIWWHLRNARHLLRTGHLVRADAWTFTASGKPWINTEWLSELPYYLAWRWRGDLGLYLATLILVSAIILGIYCLGRMRSGSWKASFAASFAAVLLSTVSLAPRTLLFGWLFLVIELAILWGVEQGRDRTVCLPFLFLIWVNTHGSWFIGFVLMVLFFACGWLRGEWGSLYVTRWAPPQKRRFLLVIAASCLALFVNPTGWRLVAYPLQGVFGHQLGTRYIAEWASLDFHAIRGKVALATFVLLGLVQLVCPRRWNLQDLIFVLIAIYGALTYTRFLFLGGILLAPLLALGFSGVRDTPQFPSPGERWVNAAGVAALLAFLVFHIPSQQQLQAGIAEALPQRALPCVRSLAGKGNLFNNFNWGGYLEWNAPQVKEFGDSRTDIFAMSGVLSDYLRATELQDTYSILDKYQIQYVLLDQESPAAYLLAHSPQWRTLYHDNLAVIFERAR